MTSDPPAPAEPSSDKSDGELAVAFVAGDEAAFTALYQRYVTRIYDFARRTVRDPAAAEDLVQTTFLTAYQRRQSLRDPEAVRAWLYRIAHNAAINQVTRSRPVDPLEDAIEPTWSGAGPEEVVLQDESAELVWDAAASLEPRQYAVLDLTVRKGLTTSEVAEVLGVAPAQASLAVFRARESLGLAVRFLLVARRRRHCERLAQLVPEGVRQLTPDQRASVDRHMRRCPDCQRMALVLTAPERLLGAAPLLALPPVLRTPPRIVPTAASHGLAGSGLHGARALSRQLVLGGAAVGLAGLGGLAGLLYVTRGPAEPRPPARPVASAPAPSGPAAGAATVVRTYQPWVVNQVSGEPAPRDGLVVSSATGSCDRGATSDPGRADAFRCVNAANLLVTCFAPPPPQTLPGPAVICSADPTAPQVELLSLSAPLPAPGGNVEDPRALPWFLVLADGRKCTLAGSGTDTAVLSYFCTGGVQATVPDRTTAAWTVREGTFRNGVPVLASTTTGVTTGYR